MAKFKVGDRVYVDKDHACGTNRMAGDVGTITNHYIGCPENYTVEFDTPRGVAGYSWIVEPDTIHKYEPLPTGIPSGLAAWLPTEEETASFWSGGKLKSCECGQKNVKYAKHSDYCPLKD